MSLLKSFGCALNGLALCLREERNLRIHLAASAWVVWLGHLCGLDRAEWAALAVCCGLVIGCELLNTAVEAAVDLLSPQYSPIARRAKDVAAAGVLAGAFFAAVAGVMLFWGRLPELSVWMRLLGTPQVLLLAAAIAATLLFIFCFPSSTDKKEKYFE